MPKYEFSIAVKDEPEPHRKKEGDIVGVHPKRPSAGRKVLDEYLLIPFECTLSLNELCLKLKVPLYNADLKNGIDFRDIEDEDADMDKYPGDLYVWDIKAEKPLTRPTRLARNRYRIPFSLLGSLDFNKVRDGKAIYQPFKKVSELISKFQANPFYKVSFDISQLKQKITKIADTNSTATPKDVPFLIYGSAPDIGEEDEKVFKWDALNDLVQDKYTNGYVLPKDL